MRMRSTGPSLAINQEHSSFVIYKVCCIFWTLRYNLTVKRYLGIVSPLILFVLLFFTIPARADGGGWPTSTPTITPTNAPVYVPSSTPFPVTEITTTPTPAYPYPAIDTSGSTMITPPALSPLTEIGGKANPEAPAAGSNAATSSQASKGLLGGSAACWPIAIIALLVGIALLNWLRSGIRRGT